jgi:hypothetical protein
MSELKGETMRKDSMKMSNDEGLVNELEEISWEDALNLMCGPLVRDENGNEVTDPRVLEVVNNATKGFKRFEFGGAFKEIYQEKFGKKNKKRRNQGVCEECGGPLD